MGFTLQGLGRRDFPAVGNEAQVAQERAGNHPLGPGFASTCSPACPDLAAGAGPGPFGVAYALPPFSATLLPAAIQRLAAGLIYTWLFQGRLAHVWPPAPVTTTHAETPKKPKPQQTGSANPRAETGAVC